MYLTDLISGEPVIQDKEKANHSAFGWYDFEELTKFDERGWLVPNLKIILPELRAQNLI